MFTIAVIYKDRVVFYPIDREIAKKYNLRNGQPAPFSPGFIRVW